MRRTRWRRTHFHRITSWYCCGSASRLYNFCTNGLISGGSVSFPTWRFEAA